MKKITLQNYKTDKYYPAIVNAVEKILEKGNVVKPSDVFIHIGMLETKHFQEWKLGRVPYLEKVSSGNLSKLNRILRILRFHVHDLNLRPQKFQQKHAKTILRYSKTGEPKLEEAYSTEFVRVISKKQHPSSI